MSWACGGRCPCTEAGRSLFARYGMAVHLHIDRASRQGQGKGRPSGRPRPRVIASGLLDRDLLLALLGVRRFRQRDREDAVLELSIDLVRIDAVRHAEGTLEGAVAALGEVVILLLLFFFVLFLALDRQRAIREFDV